ncbi:MAG: hypothetical protein ACKOX3_08990 [Bacteroidota bacterium]
MIKTNVFLIIIFCSFNCVINAQSANEGTSSKGENVYTKIDFSRLSDEVKQKVQENKRNGVPIYSGVKRALIADVLIINNSTDIQQKLLFLKSFPGLTTIKYQGGHRIQIITSLETESTTIKDLFLSNNVSANFIEQNFVVN